MEPNPHQSSPAILVTGAAGFIGSHTCVELLKSGYKVVPVDNYCNSSKDVYGKVEKITGQTLYPYDCDLLDKDVLDNVFKENQIEAVIHFAGLKAVGESVSKPLEYYRNNIVGTLNLLEVMRERGVKKLIFSSSATVYGTNNEAPFREGMPTNATNPYGFTKVHIEQILTDVCTAYPDWKVIMLRYFNPIGAHTSGLIGENPHGIPNNLMPFICKVASGELPKLNVFGSDYPTKDGTCIRDYIHVVDLALGHIKALEKLDSLSSIGIYNLGTGQGYSVLEVVHAFEKANGLEVKHELAPRRAGDIAGCYADASRAKRELGWVAKCSLEDMCRDSWNFVKKQVGK